MHGPFDGGSGPRHDTIVAALRRPEVHADGTPSVELIETHRAWVFLTRAHAYKLAKFPAAHRHDAASLEQRRLACRHELQLNQRLGGDVYQGVVALASVPDGYRVDGCGSPVEWLIAMRRLPRQLMLDVAIAEGSVQLDQVDALADALLAFYRRAQPAPARTGQYRKRLLSDIAAKQAVLGKRRYGIDPSSLRRLAAELREWLDRRAASIEARGRTLVDAHGDLRPEHICLEPHPLVIDCLEFDRELRLLDPGSELAFLALECRRLGAPWIGARLYSRLAAPLGLDSELVGFYQGYHALVRAAVAIWHLDDPEQRPERWRVRAHHYLELGLEQLEAAPRRERPRHEHTSSDRLR